MEQVNKSGEELIIRSLSLAEQYKLAAQTYNTTLETFKLVRPDTMYIYIKILEIMKN